jgi:two-component system sensor histidine kinase AtoS
MDRPPFRKRIFNKPRFIPLRYRFIFMTACMLILLLGSLTLVIGFLQSRTIRHQLEGRGLAIAQSLAATSIADLLTYNYVALERSANQAADDPDIICVIFHDKEGRVAGFSGRSDLQNTFLDDEISRTALVTPRPSVQEISLKSDKSKGLDIAVPVFPHGVGEQWGTVRVRLSLVPMYQQIRQIQWIVLAMGLIALVFGTLISIWAARRITRPLANLVQGTQEAARVNLNQDIGVHLRDEVEVLAANFDSMIRQILAHREQLEQQLDEIKRLQHYTEKLLTTMGDGLLSVDMAGNVSTINPSAVKILGLTDDQLKGKQISSLLGKFYELQAYIRDIIKNPCDRNPLEIHLPNTAEDQIILVGASILRDPMNRPQEIILNLHNITALKKLEASVRQSERLAALGTLAAGMAHEIRNPLSSIKTFVQLLPRKIDKAGFLDKFQRTVPRELKRINLLVEDLLNLARVPKFNYEIISLKALVDQTLDVIDEELRANNIRYQCKIGNNIPSVRADVSQLSKAFHNLLRNAVQAMPTGGELVIKADYLPSDPCGDDQTPGQNNSITLVIQDTGPGIPQKEIKNIFNPFFTTKARGTGLGLAITHKVITEHGGHIEVKSREGEGSQFIIRLPVYLK